MNRRQFIKRGSLLTSMALFPLSALESFATSKPDKVYRVGILGYGDRGSGLHHIIKQLPQYFQVRGICETLPYRMESAKANYPTGISFHEDYRSLCDQNDLDVIIVSTPLYLHYDHAKSVLDSGKHLFLEKTMTFTIDQAISLAKLQKDYPKQIIQIGHQYRYSPLYFRVKEMIQSDWLGKVTQIEARWDRNHNWRRPVPNPELERAINWRMYREYSGGLVAELLSHQMDFIHWAFDTHPTEIMATGGIDYFKDGRETFDNVQLTVRYEDEGMIGSYGATCANQHEGYSFKIKGSKGMVSLLTNEGVYYPEPKAMEELEVVDGVSGATKINWNTQNKSVKILDQPTKDGTFYALEDFYRCLQTGENPHANVDNGGEAAISVALANQSLYTGSREKWKSEYSLK